MALRLVKRARLWASGAVRVAPTKTAGPSTVPPLSRRGQRRTTARASGRKQQGSQQHDQRQTCCSSDQVLAFFRCVPCTWPKPLSHAVDVSRWKGPETHRYVHHTSKQQQHLLASALHPVHDWCVGTRPGCRRRAAVQSAAARKTRSGGGSGGGGVPAASALDGLMTCSDSILTSSAGAFTRGAPKLIRGGIFYAGGAFRIPVPSPFCRVSVGVLPKFYRNSAGGSAEAESLSVACRCSAAFILRFCRSSAVLLVREIGGGLRRRRRRP